MSRVAYLFAFLLLLTPSLSKAGAKPSVWSLESPRGNIVLLGSIHVGNNSFYPFDPLIEQAFNEAASLVVELDTTALNNVEVAKAMRELGMYSEKQVQSGEGLSSVLSTEAELALTKFCLGKSKIHCPPQRQMEAMRPWFLALHFANAMLASSSFDPHFGVDTYFLKKASDKTIVELETFYQQMKTFSDLDAKSQSDFLLQTLSEFNDSNALIEQLVDAWRVGDDDGLQSLVLSPLVSLPEGKAIYQALFQRRNQAMVDKLMLHMQPGQTLFVVVGAGHLLGDDGLVRLLNTQGFELSKF